jgi:hypothetical protein
VADETETKDFQGPITIEKSFEVDGRKLTAKVTFPAPVVEEAGMENLVLASNRAVWEMETNSHEIDEL